MKIASIAIWADPVAPRHEVDSRAAGGRQDSRPDIQASRDEWHLSGMFPQPYGELFAIPVDGSRPALRLTHDKWEDALAYWGGAPIVTDGGLSQAVS